MGKESCHMLRFALHCFALLLVALPCFACGRGKRVTCYGLLCIAMMECFFSSEERCLEDSGGGKQNMSHVMVLGFHSSHRALAQRCLTVVIPSNNVTQNILLL